MDRPFLPRALLLLVLAAPGAAQAAGPPPTCVRNVGLDRRGDGEGLVTLLLAGGRIAAVLDAAAPAPPAAFLVDGTGLVAQPAFLDAFARKGCAMREPESERGSRFDARADVRIDMAAADRHGIQPAFRAADFLAIDAAAAEAWRAAGFGAVLVAPGGEILAGASVLATTRDAPPRDVIVRPVVFAHAAFAASGPGYPETLMGQHAQLRQFLRDVVWHAERQMRYAAGRPGPRPPWDLDLEAGVPLVTQETTLACEAESDRDIERWLRLAEELDLVIAIAGGRDAGRAAGELAARDIPVLLTLDWGEEVEDPRAPAPATASPRGYVEPVEVRLEKRRRWEESQASALRLHEAGVRFAFGTGAGEPAALLARIRVLVGLGLPAAAAREALTAGAAALLGAGDRLGRIAPGYDATLVLWRGDPLADETARPAWVFVDGYGTELPPPAEEEAAEEAGPAAAAAGGEETGAGHAYETDERRVPRLETTGGALIQNATIHSGVAPAFAGDVLVQDGIIAAIGSSLAAPAGATVIDATGKHLAPGVIDVHSHIALAGDANEGSLSITAECDVADAIDPDDPAIYRALAGGVTAIQCLHGSANVIGGRSGALKLRFRRAARSLRLAAAPPGIKLALGENPTHAGAANRGERFPSTRMGVETLLERAFARAAEYRAGWRELAAAQARGEDPPPPRRDERLDVLVGVLEGDVRIHAHCYRADEILMLLRLAERHGFRVQTLEHAFEAYKVAAEVAAHGAGCSTSSDWWAYKMEAYDAIPQNAALLEEAGAVAAISSDSDELMRHLYHEAAKSVRYAGLDPVHALRLVTLNGARLLEIEDRAGSIEVGKDADLVLLNGDPLSIYSRVEWTMVDGAIEFERRDAFGFDAAPAPVRTLVEASPPARADGAEDGELLAIVGGTLHPVTAPAIENGTLLVRDGRILDLGADLGVPVAARVIDAGGRHVWPGLIALDTPLGLREIGAVGVTDDTGETGGNQPDVRVSAALHPASALIPVTRAGGITRAQVAPRGEGPMRGQSAIVRLAGDTWEELVAVDRDMLHLRFPPAPPPGEEDGEEPPELAALRRLLHEALEHGRRGDEAERAGATPPAHDPRLAALLPFARAEKRIAVHADDAPTILLVLEFAREEALDIVLYGAAEGWKVAEAIARSGRPVVVEPVLAVPRSPYDPYDAAYANAAVLARAGVPIAIAAGEGANARNLPYHAGMAAAFGLPREEALRAVTYYAARILGVDEELGSLAPGKIADVVITDGDLLEPASRVTHVLIDGRLQSLENRQTELYARYRDRLRRQQGR
ncbi:MAG: amidohydrolase family protein [Planctomycetota bacterium]